MKNFTKFLIRLAFIKYIKNREKKFLIILINLKKDGLPLIVGKLDNWEVSALIGIGECNCK